MLKVLIFLSFLIARLSALSIPINPSIIQLPSNLTTSAYLRQLTEWPSVPWKHHHHSLPIVLEFLAYGRRANIDLFHQIIGALDLVILSLLHQPDRFGAEPIQCNHGIVHIKVDFSRAEVRSTSVVLAVHQVRDLMEYQYRPREIGQANIWIAGSDGASELVARMEVLFGRV